MNILTARGARLVLSSIVLSFLYACSGGGGGDDVEPLQAPSLFPIGDQAVEEEQLLTFTVSASKQGSSPVLSVANLPAGANFDPSTGAFSWTPVRGDADRSPFMVTFTATDAIETGLSDSQTITIRVDPFGSGALPTAGAPIITPNGGTFVDSTTVTMTSATAGAMIYYTLDGSDPTPNSLLYSGPFELTQSATVSARAFMDGFNNSNLSRSIITITMLPAAATPVITPDGGTFVGSTTVSIASATAGAQIFYTLDGSNPTTNSTQYGGPFDLTETTTVTARAFLGGFTDSAPRQAVFTITPNQPPVLEPIGPKTVLEGETLTFVVTASDVESTPVLTADNLPAGAIFDPVTGDFEWTPALGASTGSPYSVIFTVTDADDANLTATETVEITVNSLPVAAAPTFSPVEGTYTDSTTVSLTSATSGAQIYYTLNGSDPTPASTLYTAPFALTTTTVVRAIAVQTGFADSAISQATYTITATPPAVAPTFSPVEGTYTGSATVSLTSATSGAQIYYTLNGSDPTPASTLYTAPFALTTTTVVRAIAVQTGFTDSAISQATYTITAAPPAMAPTFSPVEGTYTGSTTVTLTSATSGAQIYYTLNGSDPSPASTLYTTPFDLTTTTVVRAIAAQTGFTNSAISQATYTIQTVSAECQGQPIPSVQITAPAALDLVTTNSIAVETITCINPAEHSGVRIQLTGDNGGGLPAQDITNAPYNAIFSGIQKDEYTVSAVILDSDGNEINGAPRRDVITPVGYGDYYVAFGDSITNGRGDNSSGDDTSDDGRNSSRGYPPILNDELTTVLSYPHSVVNAGVEGETSAGGVARVSGVLSANPLAQRVLVMYGMNDARPSLPRPSGRGLNTGDAGYAGSFKDNMQQIINAIRNAGMQPILAKVNIALGDSNTGPQYSNPDLGARSVLIKEYNQVIDELRIANGIGISAPDFYDLFFQSMRYLSEYDDNIHPNGTGYQAMAALWRQILAP